MQAFEKRWALKVHSFEAGGPNSGLTGQFIQNGIGINGTAVALYGNGFAQYLVVVNGLVIGIGCVSAQNKGVEIFGHREAIRTIV